MAICSPLTLTPPVPCSSTVSPRPPGAPRGRNWLMAIQAVTAAMGRHAASSSDMWLGARTRPVAGKTRCVCSTPSSGRPRPDAMMGALIWPVRWAWLKVESTRSPTAQSSASLSLSSPMATTVPHMSEQGTRGSMSPELTVLWWL